MTRKRGRKSRGSKSAIALPAKKAPILSVDTGTLCAYCNKPTEMCDGRSIYPHRPDLWDKGFYRCEPCDAYVGMHPNSRRAMGRVANAELRRAKHGAHMAFDFLWEAKARALLIPRNEARRMGYKWLAEQMGIDPKHCHIGNFDLDACNRVIQFCEPFVDRIKFAERMGRHDLQKE